MAKHDIALVLSSGAARGVAHIAVIEELLKDGHRITSVAGSSMGAVVGGLYAAGTLPEYTNWLRNLDYWDVFNLLDFSISSKGFIKGEKVFKKIGPYLPNVNIEDLPIPFLAVASDIIKKEVVIYDQGSLKDAIRATVSIPTILHPIKKNDSIIVDGGVVNPIPVDLIKRHPGDKLVVVDANANIPFERPKMKAKEKSFMDNLMTRYGKWRKTEKKKDNDLGIFDMMNESFDLTQETLSKLLLEKYKPDLTVNVSRKVCGTMDFHKTPEVLALGREAYHKAKAENNSF
ncbi:MAG: patatin-like phospholipase family protein [Bacteroidota bacterium]